MILKCVRNEQRNDQSRLIISYYWDKNLLSTLPNVLCILRFFCLTGDNSHYSWSYVSIVYYTLWCFWIVLPLVLHSFLTWHVLITTLVNTWGDTLLIPIVCFLVFFCLFLFLPFYFFSTLSFLVLCLALSGPLVLLLTLWTVSPQLREPCKLCLDPPSTLFYTVAWELSQDSKLGQSFRLASFVSHISGITVLRCLMYCVLIIIISYSISYPICLFLVALGGSIKPVPVTLFWSKGQVPALF